ncbi:hypothetical protein UFOVP89_25 [uncultured Caudovirales phage]|uniref:Uncharacterized protein n=1 Tax=uncultured Caudovirales phage TaxID=2100421 RepID=A0A6J5L2Y0_9CAUD|nr:hypothetical protein UFOVP89_25 [uncultured Caudovirales phage]
MTQEDIIVIYKKVFPTGYEPITVERMTIFARLIEEKVKS